MSTGLKLGGKRSQKSPKKWLRIRDTYGVEIELGQNTALILTITTALDHGTRLIDKNGEARMVETVLSRTFFELLASSLHMSLCSQTMLG
jgi:hypothetical protein